MRSCCFLLPRRPHMGVHDVRNHCKSIRFCRMKTPCAVNRPFHVSPSPPQSQITSGRSWLLNDRIDTKPNENDANNDYEEFENLPEMKFEEDFEPSATVLSFLEKAMQIDRHYREKVRTVRTSIPFKISVVILLFLILISTEPECIREAAHTIALYSRRCAPSRRLPRCHKPLS